MVVVDELPASIFQRGFRIKLDTKCSLNDSEMRAREGQKEMVQLSEKSRMKGEGSLGSYFLETIVSKF